MFRKTKELQSLIEKVMEEKKRVFCPACGRMVSVSFIVAGLCKDCFNND